MRKEFPLLLSLLFITINSQAQDKPEKEWLGERITNTSIYLDPNEVQVFCSFTGLTDRDAVDYQYIPFGFGGNHSIVSRKLGENKGWELVGEYGAQVQFEWRILENGTQQRNLINTDYRITVFYARKINKFSTYRIRGYHVSSHLGDDYLIRNEVRSYSTNKVNYEQIEFTYYHTFYRYFCKVYAGAGGNIRPNDIRLPFAYHFGATYLPVQGKKKWRMTGGFNVKGFQETDFTPGFKAAIGPAFYKDIEKEPLRIAFEYYTGHLPYSQFEPQRIEWLGVGLYFYL